MKEGELAKNKKFTIPARLKSFQYASQGIWYFVKTQHNAWIHVCLASLVIFFGFFFQVSWQEWCWLVLAMGFVLVSEAFNTAIEALVDLVCPEFHPLAGIVKDVSSGAVFLAAITSAIIGLIIFLPYFWDLFLSIKNSW